MDIHYGIAIAVYLVIGFLITSLSVAVFSGHRGGGIRTSTDIGLFVAILLLWPLAALALFYG